MLPKSKFENYDSESSYSYETERYQSGGKAGPKTPNRHCRKHKGPPERRQTKLQSAAANLKAGSKPPLSHGVHRRIVLPATQQKGRCLIYLMLSGTGQSSESVPVQGGFGRLLSQLLCVDPRKSRSKTPLSRSTQVPRTGKQKVVNRQVQKITRQIHIVLENTTTLDKV